jgi:hypothetical protein
LENKNMSHVAKTLDKLQNKVFFKYNKVKPKREGAYGASMGFNAQYPPTEDPEDYDVDKAYGQDEPYTTFVSGMLPSNMSGKDIFNKLRGDKNRFSEQEDPSNDEIAAAAGAGEAAGEEAGAAAGADAAGGIKDMGGGEEFGGEPGGGAFGGMEGMGEEEPKEPKELGRVYELKKIYSRLTSIEAYLADESSEFLLKLRSVVAQAIELFEIIASNIDSYKERMDDIIIMFYKFILEVYDEVQKYYSKESRGR